MMVAVVESIEKPTMAVEVDCVVVGSDDHVHVGPPLVVPRVVVL